MSLGEVKQSSGNYPVYTGITKLKVKSLNSIPNKVYYGIENNIKFFILDFHVENENSKNIISFKVLDTEDKTKDGKNWYINQFGKNSCALNEEGLAEWFKEGDVKIARIGECELTDFLKVWLNKKAKSPCRLEEEDLQKLFKGDFEWFIKDYVNKAETEVYFMQYAKQSQDGSKWNTRLYSKWFENGWKAIEDNTDKNGKTWNGVKSSWNKHISNEYDKAYWEKLGGFDFENKLFTPPTEDKKVVEDCPF